MNIRDRANEPKQVVRSVGGGYDVYDYPRSEAEAVAARAAKLFEAQFKKASPAVGIDEQKVGNPSLYLEKRGTPFINFSQLDGNGSFGVVAESPSGELALEIQVSNGSVHTSEGQFDRWDKELRAPSWELICSEPDLF
jgi:hypothetical protein